MLGLPEKSSAPAVDTEPAATKGGRELTLVSTTHVQCVKRVRDRLIALSHWMRTKCADTVKDTMRIDKEQLVDCDPRAEKILFSPASTGPDAEGLDGKGM